MKWYIAKLVFYIGCGTPQFDEQHRLIAAHNEKSALHKARQIGIKQEEIFVNSHAQKVEWKFIDVAELSEVDELVDGAELFYRIEETEDAQRYISMVKQKAMNIEKRPAPLPLLI